MKKKKKKEKGERNVGARLNEKIVGTVYREYTLLPSLNENETRDIFLFIARLLKKQARV